MILHIPVEGGHQGGRLTLVHKGKLKSFFNHVNSHRQLHVWAFHHTCQQVLEPLTSGAMVLLVVRLVWTNPPMDPLFRQLDVPAFLESLMEVNQCLDVVPWNSGPGPSKDPSGMAKRDQGFFFFLQNQYDLTTWDFNDLKGEDRLLAMLLRSCPLTEIHLTTIRRCFDEVQPDEEDYDESMGCSCCMGGHSMGAGYRYLELTSITVDNCWIHPTDGRVTLPSGLSYENLHGRLVGGGPNQLHSTPADREADEEKVNEEEVRQHFYVTPVLFVWPKSQSVRNYCKYGFDALLDRLENRQDALEELRQVLSFIRESPAQVWRDPDSGGADRAERLFRLCIKFEAKEEGLDLLDLLSVEFSSGGTQKTFEGIRDDKVAQAVADFECQVGGKSPNRNLFNRNILK